MKSKFRRIFLFLTGDTKISTEELFDFLHRAARLVRSDIDLVVSLAGSVKKKRLLHGGNSLLQLTLFGKVMIAD